MLLVGTEQDEEIRLSAARRLGFSTLTVSPSLPPLSEQIELQFHGGADALIEASGSTLALGDSWRSVRPNGVVTAVALYSRVIELDLTQFLRKQIDLRTSYASSLADYQRAFDLLKKGYVNTNELLSFYNLSDAQKGFTDSENLKVMKVILNCQN